MKTTLVIHDQIMRRLKQEAAQRGCTISELVESALRLLLDKRQESRRELPPLPTRHSGKLLVDVANREVLYEVMEGR